MARSRSRSRTRYKVKATLYAFAFLIGAIVLSWVSIMLVDRLLLT